MTCLSANHRTDLTKVDHDEYKNATKRHLNCRCALHLSFQSQMKTKKMRERDK
jgi:hypothetical protein